MDNLVTGSNPYIIDEPVADPVMFFGHSEVLGWVKEMVRSGRLVEPLVLFGPPGVGKSSILKQLERGYLGEGTAVIAADIESLPLSGLSDFLWEFARGLDKKTLPSEVVIPVSLLDKGRFLENPTAAFDQFLTLLREERLPGKQLILAFDDLDILAGQSQAGFPEHEILTYLYNLLQREEKLGYIFTLNGLFDRLPSNALAPFSLSTAFPVTNFDLDTTLTFLRQSALFNTSAVVGKFIYDLTGGHPGDIQRYCYELYKRRQNRQLLHVTLADVVAVTRQAKKENYFQAAVHSHLIQEPVTIAASAGHPEGMPVRPLQPEQSRGKKLPTRWLLRLLLTVVLLFAGGRFVLASVLERPDPPAIAHLPTATDRPTPTMMETAVGMVASATVADVSTLTPTGDASPTAAAAIQTVTAQPTPTDTAEPTPTPTPEPTLFAGSGEFSAVVVREMDNMPMLLIPGGTFIMGAPTSDPSAGFDESPEHEVRIDTFYMDKFEVTVGQYAAFLNTLGTYSDACEEVDCAWPRSLIGYTSYLLEIEGEDGLTYLPMEGFENYPINHVSWYGADSYCRAMAARLPTEAEWEYAARGNDGRIYPWGNEPPDETRAVYFSTSYSNLKPVDALPAGASPFGILGLAGSMWEWVADWYDPNYYQNSPAENPQGPEEGEHKVVRGGAWPNNNQEDRVRSANRNSRDIIFFSPDLGFRCASDLPPAEAAEIDSIFGD